jgi:tRNA(His) 5'-end guanylyltransferase
VLAGLASATFVKLARERIPQKTEPTPCFDCRVWQVPTRREALEVFVWREDDAVKNSISMAAGAFYPDAELRGKNSAAKQELLFQKGVNWSEYPAAFKRGTYLSPNVRNP